MKLNWGICSTGKMAATFADALNHVQMAACYAVSSRTLSKAEAFAEEHHFEHAYGDYAEMLADPEVDIVYVASPMSCHFRDAMQALRAGKHVLCEKSVTMCTKEWESLVKEAYRQKVFLMEAMWMKCRPAFRKALYWYNQGKIGTVKLVQADFCKYVPYREDSRLYRPELGGGALLDLGVYPLTLAEAFLEGTATRMYSAAYIGPSGVDYDMTATVQYPNGIAMIRAGFSGELDNKAIIVGTQGKIILGENFHCATEVQLFDANGTVLQNCYLPDDYNGYEYEIEEVQRCIFEGRTQSILVPQNATKEVMRQMDWCRLLWKKQHIVN